MVDRVVRVSGALHGLAIVALLAACGGGPGMPREPAAPRPLPGAAPVAVLELHEYLAGLLTVPVAVGDTTLPFLFDTGGGGTLYTPEAAGAVGCEPFGRLTGFRHDGEAVHLERCAPAPVVIDGWSSPAAETGVFDLMALLPDGVPPLGGLMALQTFDGLAVTLALSDRQVVVESPGSLARRVVAMTEVPMRESRQAGGAAVDVFLAFRAAGGPVWMELDSGNTGPVYIAPHAAAQLALDLSADETRTITLHLEGFGPVEVEARLREMIYDGLLNAAFLRGLRVTLDLDRERAWVERTD